MRNKLLCGVAAVAITAVIGANDVAAQPAGLFNWSGFYVGGHLGGGQARFDATIIGPGVTTFNADNKPSGIVGGAHVGQNWQMNTFVYGWEADISATDWQKSALGAANSQRLVTDVKLLASLRARLGMSFDRTLFYATGGLAYIRSKFSVFTPSNAVNGKFNKFGGVAGLGVEWKQTQHLSWRLEGLWYIFDSSKNGLVNHDSTHTANIKLKDALVGRLGATLHF